MRQTATISEIALATGKHETTIRRNLAKKSCSHIWRTGQSGNEKHFFISLLPESYRIALVKERALPKPTTTAGYPLHAGEAAARKIIGEQAEKRELALIAKEAGLAAFDLLSDDQKAIANARYDFIKTCQTFVQAAGIKPRRGAQRSRVGEELFLEQYNKNNITLDDAVQAVAGNTVSWSTYNRWMRAFNQGGLAALSNSYHNPNKGRSSLSADQQKTVIEIMIKNPATSGENIRKALLGRYQKEVPSVGVIRRYRDLWIAQNQEFWLFLTNPDEWRNKKMFAFGSASEKVTSLNGLWEADSTPADLMLKDGRHSLIGMIDVWSRRMKLFVSKTSRAIAVISLLRHCILGWGVPEILKTDNGKDYISKHVVRVLDSLDIEQVLCTPFKGEEKPHMERGFRTFLHGLVELMPGYIGHNVAERKAIEARRTFADRVMNKGSDPVQVNLTSQELQEICDKWTENVYQHDKHGGLNGKKPIEMVRSWQEPIRRISNTRALDLLLMPAPDGNGIRVIGKKGIQVENRMYQSPDFAGHIGDKALILLDPVDLGTAYVYLMQESGEKKFLCAAIDPIFTGIDRKEFYTKAKNHQAKMMRERKRQLIQDTKSEGEREAFREYIDYREAQVENIINLPQKSTEHTSAGLEEAYRALDIIDNQYSSKDPAQLSEADEQKAMQILAETAPEPQPKSVKVVDARGNFHQKKIKDADQSGWENLDGWERFEFLQTMPALTDTQQKWIEYYKTTSEYLTLQDIYENDAYPGAF
jgi:hypothetical protein